MRSTPNRGAHGHWLTGPEKTGGNPFFAIQFFVALADEGLPSSIMTRRAGRWKLDRIHAKGYTDKRGGPHGRKIDPPAGPDPSGVAAVRLPRQRRRDHDAFDRSGEIERGRWFGSLGRRSSGTGRALGAFVQARPRPCSGGRVFSDTGTVAPRGAPARRKAGSRLKPPRKNAKRPSSTSSISSTAAPR